MIRRLSLITVATVGALLLPGMAALAAPPGVDPSTVDITLLPGQSTTVTKNVTTAEIPPNPDVVLLADTTGSMIPAIGNVQNNAGAVTGAVLAAQPTAQFGVSSYRDEGDSYLFRVEQDITADTAAVQAGIDQWAANEGGDLPESAINALFELASGAVNFRTGGTKIVAWFGDAPSHNPSNGRTLAQTIDALVDAEIRVVAVNVGDGSFGQPGLDADALDTAENEAGQATAIVNATGGVLLNAADDQVAQAILEGIQAVQSTVTPTVTSCDLQLSVTNSPASATVASGDTATFTETITVANGTAPGEYHCTVDYLVDGVSQGFVEHTTVHVRGLSVNDVTVDEGAGNAVFTVTLLGGPSPTPVTVNVATANATATAPADYTAIPTTTVTFAPGETSKPVPVPVVQDAVDEPNETFTLNLSAPSTGVFIVDGQGVATIVDDDRDGTFSCTATAADVAGITAAVANPANLPCVDDSKTVASVFLNAGLINVSSSALTARTNLTPDDQSLPPAAGDRAESTARVDRTTISTLGLNIELGLIQSQATASCVTGPGGLTPDFTGSSNVTSLKINGVPVTVGSAPLTIPLVIGSLHLNRTTIANGVVTQQAVALETPLARIVLAKSQADVHGTAAHPGGSPCTR
ncbi:MAG TPA: Calx-beta domain-containing protein [Actinophytocola sp.]|uniref:Calx-beta domain-containing protein n=1 Tax=Actinophytocola sp. TaxID=1872138 RepID=UPI002DDD6099|nr:Calx-beta domain-containing protein [Actinophytocola sp.]HEV2782595.1 Calx-beta domain-containing protein [Actinophytocola sp.]